MVLNPVISVSVECQHLWKQILVTTATVLLFLSSGCTYGFSAVLLPQIKEDKEVEYDEKYDSWIAAFAPLFMAIGSLISGPFADKVGRKLSHIILLWPFLIGWLIHTVAADTTYLIIGRALTGCGTGIFKSISTIYIGEIADPRYRSIMLFSLSFSANFGILVCHVIGGCVNWKISSLLFSAPITIAFIVFLFAKESPLWLISKGRTAEGIESFEWYRFKNEASDRELCDVLEKQRNKTELTFKEILSIVFSNKFLKPFLLVLLMIAACQCCGSNTFMFYAQDLLKSSFSSNIDPFIFMIVVDCTRTITSLLLLAFGNLWPRRKAYMTSAVMTCFFLFALVLCISILPVGLEWIAVITLMLFIGFASAMIAFLWSLVAEIFPSNVRGLGASLSVSFSFFLLFISIKITPMLLPTYGSIIVFSVFLVLTTILLIIIFFLLPETNGKTLQEIEDHYAKEG